MKETPVMQNIRLGVGELPNVRLFRNNTGKLQDATGRWVEFGLCVGSSDLIGWTTREITPDMVGKKVAVFTAIEVKTASGATRPEQSNFIDRVREAGGIAGVARSPEDAREIILNR
jgi:hypothetical protein